MRRQSTETNMQCKHLYSHPAIGAGDGAGGTRVPPNFGKNIFQANVTKEFGHFRANAM